MVIKLDYDGDMRRISMTMPEDSDSAQKLKGIRTAVAQVLGIEESALPALRYKDDEGDLCTLVEASLDDLMQLSKSSTMKLFASKSGSPQVFKRVQGSPSGVELVAGPDVGTIGLVFQTLPPDPLVIKRVTPDTWAAANGIEPGDTFEAVNGRKVQDLTADEFKAMMAQRPLSMTIGFDDHPHTSASSLSVNVMQVPAVKTPPNLSARLANSASPQQAHESSVQDSHTPVSSPAATGAISWWTGTWWTKTWGGAKTTGDEGRVANPPQGKDGKDDSVPGFTEKDDATKGHKHQKGDANRKANSGEQQQKKKTRAKSDPAKAQTQEEAQQEAEDAAAKLRAELEAMKKSALRKHACNVGVSDDDLDKADDAEDTKAAMIELVMMKGCHDARELKASVCRGTASTEPPCHEETDEDPSKQNLFDQEIWLSDTAQALSQAEQDRRAAVWCSNLHLAKKPRTDKQTPSQKS